MTSVAAPLRKEQPVDERAAHSLKQLVDEQATCRHMQPVVDGADTLANAVQAIQTDTRRFARRQRTWVRAVPEVHWYDPRKAEPIFAHVDAFLAGSEPRSTGAPRPGEERA